MQILERIMGFMQHHSLTQIEFCKKAGISPATFSANKINGSDIKSSNIAKIKKAYPLISLEWLILGEGDMLLPTPSAAVPMQNMTFINGNGNTQIYSPADCAEKLREKDLEISRLAGQIDILKELLNSK